MPLSPLSGLFGAEASSEKDESNPLQTRVGGACNQIIFEDKSNVEVLYMFAMRDLIMEAGHDALAKVERNFRVVDKNEFTSIGGNAASNVVGNSATYIKGDLTAQVGGSSHLWFENALTAFVKSFACHSEETIEIDAPKEIVLRCGESKIKLTPSGVWIDGPMIHLNQPDAAVGKWEPVAPPRPAETIKENKDALKAWLKEISERTNPRCPFGMSAEFLSRDIDRLH